MLDVPLQSVKESPGEAAGILPGQEKNQGDHMLGHHPRRSRTGAHGRERLFLLVAAGGPGVGREDRVDGHIRRSNLIGQVEAQGCQNRAFNVWVKDYPSRLGHGIRIESDVELAVRYARQGLQLSPVKLDSGSLHRADRAITQ